MSAAGVREQISVQPLPGGVSAPSVWVGNDECPGNQLVWGKWCEGSEGQSAGSCSRTVGQHPDAGWEGWVSSPDPFVHMFSLVNFRLDYLVGQGPL